MSAPRLVDVRIDRVNEGDLAVEVETTKTVESYRVSEHVAHGLMCAFSAVLIDAPAKDYVKVRENPDLPEDAPGGDWVSTLVSRSTEPGAREFHGFKPDEARRRAFAMLLGAGELNGAPFKAGTGGSE